MNLNPIAWFRPKPQAPAVERGSPVDVTPTIGNFFGTGIGSPIAGQRVLLDQRQGVPELAQRAIKNRVSAVAKWEVVREVRVDADTTEDEVLDDHPLTQLLADPHPDFTTSQLFGMEAELIGVVGEGYLYLVNNAFGRPATLQPLQAGTTHPIVEKGVVERYAFTDGNGEQTTLRREDVLRFWSPDASTLYTSRGTFGPNYLYNDTMSFQGQQMRAFYQNDATPPTVLKAGADATVMSEGDKDRIATRFARQHNRRAGTRQGLPAMLPTNWDLIQLAAQSGADVTPLLEWLTQEQLMNTGVPNAILGRVVSGDRSSAETVQYIFDLYTITPIMDMMADVLTASLARRFSPDIFVRYVPFVQPDKAFELARETADSANKVRSPQQILRDRKADPDDAPWGEVPAGTIADQPYTGEVMQDLPPEPPPDEPLEDEDEEESEQTALGRGRGITPRLAAQAVGRQGRSQPRPRTRRVTWSKQAAWQRVIANERKWSKRMDRAARVVFVEQEKASLAAFRKAQRAIEDDAFSAESFGRLWDVHFEPVRRAAYFDNGQQALNLLTGDEFVFTASVDSTLERQGAQLVTEANATTLKALRLQLREGAQAGEGVSQLTKRIQSVFRGRRANARTIARTELLKASQAAQLESFDQAGVERHQWNTSRDGLVRDSHYIDGQVVARGESFTLRDGATGAYPGDEAFGASNAINCRCFLTPVIEGVTQTPTPSGPPIGL